MTAVVQRKKRQTETETELVSHWSLTFCQPHRDRRLPGEDWGEGERELEGERGGGRGERGCQLHK